MLRFRSQARGHRDIRVRWAGGMGGRRMIRVSNDFMQYGDLPSTSKIVRGFFPRMEVEAERSAVQVAL